MECQMNHAATEQLAIWTSEFGEEYTQRNNVLRPRRVDAWRTMLGINAITSILEVGCNIGWNFQYISQVGQYELHGIEPQAAAVTECRGMNPGASIQCGNAFDLPHDDDTFDLVFTSGVLIHIHPTDVARAIDEMYRVSKRYLLYVEYDHPIEEEVPYRGKSGALWRRNHRQCFEERYPDLKVVRSGVWDKGNDYDDCGWCLFEKPQP